MDIIFHQFKQVSNLVCLIIDTYKDNIPQHVNNFCDRLEEVYLIVEGFTKLACVQPPGATVHRLHKVNYKIIYFVMV